MNLCEICRTHSEQFHILRPPPRLRWVWNLPDAELPRRNTFRLSGSKTNTFLLEIPELKTDRSYSKGGFLWIILLRIPHTLLMPFPNESAASDPEDRITRKRWAKGVLAFYACLLLAGATAIGVYQSTTTSGGMEQHATLGADVRSNR